jgi:hypothetical protein
MSLTKSLLLGAAAATASALLLAPASASAGPNFASVSVVQAEPGGHPLKDLIVDVEPSMGDNTARVISVRYEEGAFVFTDPAGMLPQPGVAPGFPGGNSCVQAGPRAVRCPVDLTDPAIHGTSFDVRTFGGDDRIDLRGMPDLPGGMLSGSPEVDLNGPARPSFQARGGDDVVLTGAYDASGDLGPGNDRLIGGPGADGLANLGGPGGGLSGGRGNDRMVGGPGNDWLLGDLGNDFLKGDAGRDILVGGLGNDRLHSRDGQVDFMSCGPGRRSRQPIRRDRIDKRLRHEGKLTHYGCISKD